MANRKPVYTQEELDTRRKEIAEELDVDISKVEVLQSYEEVNNNVGMKMKQRRDEYIKEHGKLGDGGFVFYDGEAYCTIYDDYYEIHMGEDYRLKGGYPDGKV